MDESVYMNDEIHEDDLIDNHDGYDFTGQEAADTPPPNL